MKWIITSFGGVCVTYCLAVLIYVISSPDLPIRCLLTNSSRHQQDSYPGVMLRQVLIPLGDDEGPLEYFGTRPKEGDFVLSIAGVDTPTFFQFASAIHQLRNPEMTQLNDDHADPSELDFFFDGSLKPVVEFPDGRRAAKVTIWREGWDAPASVWLVIHPIAWTNVLLTTSWFGLQLILFAFAALAQWRRPHDLVSRLFFVMNAVTMAAFCAGFHWWIIGGSPLLNVPFMWAAFCLPAICFHFFAYYPTANGFVYSLGWRIWGLLYSVPVLYALVVMTCAICVYISPTQAILTVEPSQYLRIIRWAIYSYLPIAVLYFAGCIFLLVSNIQRVQNPLEQKQLRLILWTCLLALIPMLYTVFLAFNDRVGFALGKARIPMFLVSLSFTVAYTIGVFRYRLMVIDQVINRGMLYYVAGNGVTLAFGVIVVFGSLLASSQNWIMRERTFLVAFLFVLAIFLLLWFRDKLQQVIDRRFFREKYRLNRALQKMNVAVDDLLDRQMLADRMLDSIREVLRVDHVGLYLRDGETVTFQRILANDQSSFPQKFVAEKSFVTVLEQSGCVQRTTPGSRQQLSLQQNQLRELNGYLVQALETNVKLTGFVVLGNKENNVPFTAEDVTFLQALGQITNVALYCASMRQDVDRLNDRLKEKLDKIEEQNRQIALLRKQLPVQVGSGPSSEVEMAPHDIVGSSAEIKRVLRTVRKVAKADASVLIRGESGTGKELIARAIHRNSPRCDQPMISVHCAALSSTLLESELFGHAKGAFTGAQKDRPGRFELANGGTLFLDEIGDVSLETQVKLLRVLQERMVERVGDSRPIEVDVRLVAATHQDLEKLIREGKFREDLFYRLNVIGLHVPALRERRDDILELAAWFLKRSSERLGKGVTEIDDDALLAIENYAWPGNIRELENVIEHAVVLTESSLIELEHLPEAVRRNNVIEVTPATRYESRSRQAEVIPFSSGMEIAEKSSKSYSVTSSMSLPIREAGPFDEPGELRRALRESKGNKAEAARLLGMPRSTFYSKLKKYESQGVSFDAS